MDFVDSSLYPSNTGATTTITPSTPPPPTRRRMTPLLAALIHCDAGAAPADVQQNELLRLVPSSTHTRLNYLCSIAPHYTTTATVVTTSSCVSSEASRGATCPGAHSTALRR